MRVQRSLLALLLALAAGAFGQPVYVPAAPPAPEPGLTCLCNSTAGHRAPGELAPVFLSVDPTVLARWSHVLNAPLPGNVSFLCDCKPIRPNAAAPPQHYLLSASQADAAPVSAADCLGSATLTTVCTGLKQLGFFRCDTVWSTGVAGVLLTNDLAVGPLADAAQRLSAAHSGPCARTITFAAVVDSYTDY